MTAGREESALLRVIEAPLVAPRVGPRVGPRAAPRVRAGEEEAASRLYREYCDAVARWVSHLVGPQGDVEDLVHEVFLIAFRKLPEFRGEARVSTWLYRIARNVVRNHRRKQRIRRWFGGAMPEVEEAPADAVTPAEELERRRREALVYQVLDQLSEKQRMILVLFEIEERPGAEIAELLGIKIGTVWVQLHRARAEFLKRLETLEGARAG